MTFISARPIHPPIPRSHSRCRVGLGGGCFDPLPAGWVEEEKTITLRGGAGNPIGGGEAVTKLFLGILMLLLLLGWGGKDRRGRGWCRNGPSGTVPSPLACDVFLGLLRK